MDYARDIRNNPIRVAFDVGGVLSKYPAIFVPLLRALQGSAEVEVYFLTDMPREKAEKMLALNGLEEEAGILCADYEKYGESCKAVACAEMQIDVLIDDHPGYVATPRQPMVRLLTMPDPELPYYHNDWKTDPADGTFGRKA